jgi:hypothetical protein
LGWIHDDEQLRRIGFLPRGRQKTSGDALTDFGSEAVIRGDSRLGEKRNAVHLGKKFGKDGLEAAANFRIGFEVGDESGDSGKISGRCPRSSAPLQQTYKGRSAFANRFGLAKVLNTPDKLLRSDLLR